MFEKLFEDQGLLPSFFFDVCPAIPQHCADIDYNALNVLWPAKLDGRCPVVNYCNYVWSEWRDWHKEIFKNYKRGANIVVLALESTFDGDNWKKYFGRNQDVVYGKPFKTAFKGEKRKLP